MILIRIDDRTFCGEDIIVQFVTNRRRTLNNRNEWDREFTNYVNSRRQEKIFARIIFPAVSDRTSTSNEPDSLNTAQISIRHNLDDLLDFGKCQIIKEFLIEPAIRWESKSQLNITSALDQKRHAVDFVPNNPIVVVSILNLNLKWLNVVEE